ncbi:MAG: GNAT family N-acetyltransferase [Saprospiraceae bacterium]|nr:GNAT family N-acetyltransferase [Saprospiraceae bacterium]
MVIAENEIIKLRTWQHDDAALLYNLNADPDVLQYTGDEAFASIEDARTFVANYRDFERFGCGRWIIEYKNSGELPGWCGLKYHHDLKSYDLGFRLMKKYWNQGLATEASRLAMDYGANTLGIVALTAKAMIENVASIRVLMKLGFRARHCSWEHGHEWQHFLKNIS